MSEKIERRPFHETIVDAICRDRMGAGLSTIAWLLMETKIPKGHDEIVTALRERLHGIDHRPINSFWTDVVLDVLEQKREAEAEARQRQEIEQRLIREDALES